jgi:hypothetical protein
MRKGGLGRRGERTLGDPWGIRGGMGWDGVIGRYLGK